MSYKILFFSVNRHQEKYFEKLLAAVRGGDQGISLHKRELFFRLPECIVNKQERGIIKEVNHMRLAYLENKTGKKRHFITRLVTWLLYCISTTIFLLKIKRVLKKQHFNLIVLWNDMKWHQFIIKKLAGTQGVKTAFFENGALPNSVTFDQRGVNFNNSVPRERDFYLTRYTGSPPSESESSPITLDEGYIFIPFQVDYDTQILSHSPWVHNMEELYFIAERLLISLPQDVHVVIKEHPKSARSYEYLHNRNPRILFENTTETEHLVTNSKAVITVNSTVGLESILKDKPVLVLGNAFYSIDGLCQKVECEAELFNKVSRLATPNKTLKNSFIEYLKEYYVAGNWHQPSTDHIKNIEENIYEYLEEV